MLRILIIRTTALGDIVHTFPALMALRNAFPNCHISWVVEKRFASILKNIKEIDAIYPIELKNGLSKILDAIKILQQQPYDISLDFQGLLKSALIGVASKSIKRFGFCPLNSRECANLFYNKQVDKFCSTDNITQLNNALVKELYFNLTNKTLNIDIGFPNFTSVDDKLNIDNLLNTHVINKFVLINPGGAWQSKLWSPKYYARLIDGIKTKFNLNSVLTCFGSERELGFKINKYLATPVPILDALTYTQQAELSKRASVAIGPDTGPLHIAHAVNCPTIFLFGASDAWRNTPSGNQAYPIQAPLDCKPCWKKICPKYSETKCMQSIKPELVLNKLNSILGI